MRLKPAARAATGVAYRSLYWPLKTSYCNRDDGLVHGVTETEKEIHVLINSNYL